MSVSYEDNNNKKFTNSTPVEGRRKPSATTLPNLAVVDPDYHNNAAHTAMTKINNYIYIYKIKTKSDQTTTVNRISFNLHNVHW